MTDTAFKMEIKRMHTILDIPILSDRYYYENVRQLFSSLTDTDLEKAVSYIISTYRFKIVPTLSVWKDAIAEAVPYRMKPTEFKGFTPISEDEKEASARMARKNAEMFAIMDAEEKGNSDNVGIVHSIKSHRAEMLKQGRVKNRKTGEWVLRSQMKKGESYTNYNWFVLQRNDIAGSLAELGIVLEDENIIFG